MTYPGSGTSSQVDTSQGSGNVSKFQDASEGGLSSLRNAPAYIENFGFGSQGATGYIGDLGWTRTPGGGFSNLRPGDKDHPGLMELSSGTSTSSYVSLHTDENIVTFSGGQWTFDTVVQLDTLSDASNAYKVYIGFYDVPAMSSSGEGIYFTYTHSENSGNWTLNSSDAPGSNTTSDSGVAADTNFVNLKVIMNAAGTSSEFFINGTSRGTITTTLPGTSEPTMPFYGIIKSAGTNQRLLNLDALYLQGILTNARFS